MAANTSSWLSWFAVICIYSTLQFYFQLLLNMNVWTSHSPAHKARHHFHAFVHAAPTFSWNAFTTFLCPQQIMMMLMAQFQHWLLHEPFLASSPHTDLCLSAVPKSVTFVSFFKWHSSALNCLVSWSYFSNLFESSLKARNIPFTSLVSTATPTPILTTELSKFITLQTLPLFSCPLALLSAIPDNSA